MCAHACATRRVCASSMADKVRSFEREIGVRDAWGLWPCQPPAHHAKVMFNILSSIFTLLYESGRHCVEWWRGVHRWLAPAPACSLEQLTPLSPSPCTARPLCGPARVLVRVMVAMARCLALCRRCCRGGQARWWWARMLPLVVRVSVALFVSVGFVLRITQPTHVGKWK